MENNLNKRVVYISDKQVYVESYQDLISINRMERRKNEAISKKNRR